MSFNSHDHLNVSEMASQKLFIIRFLQSQRSKYRSLKIVFSILSGIIFGLFIFLKFYYFMRIQLGEAAIAGGISAILVSLLLLFVYMSRCVFTLLIPSLCTAQGKAILFSVILNYIMLGPCGNIMHNVNETTKSMTCLRELAVDHAKMAVEELKEKLKEQFKVHFAIYKVAETLYSICSFIISNFVPNLNMDVNLRNDTIFTIDSDVNFTKVKEDIIREMKERFEYIVFAADILRKIASVAVILLLLSCWLYTFRYRGTKFYDNHYITKKMILHDKDTNGQLFPLFKTEKRKWSTLNSPQLSTREMRILIFSLIIFVGHTLLAVAIFTADQAYFTVLNFFNKNSIVGKLSNSSPSTNGSDVRNKLHSCLPLPRQLNSSYIHIVTSIYLVLLITILLQAYSSRLRSTIVGYYYPDKMKQRMIYLYDKISRRRRRGDRKLKLKVPFIMKENQLTEKLVKNAKGKVKMAIRFCYLFGYFRRRCLICGDRESIISFKKPITCNKNTDCQGFYCYWCFRERNGHCLFCK